MRICDLTQSYAPTGGGVRTYIHAKRDWIRDSGDEHEHLLIVPGREDAVAREGRLVTRTIASPPVPGSGVYRMLLRSDKVLRALREARPDVIEVHCAYNLPWTALHYRGERPDVRVVGVYMTDLPRAYVEPAARRLLGERLGGWARERAERYVCRLYGRMDATVAISPALATRLEALGVPGVTCIPLGVDLDVFHPARRDADVRRRLGAGPDAPVLVYAGRLDGEKRAALVVEAFERLPRELGAHLVLVGDGPLRAPLEARAEGDPRLHVLPFQQDRAELARLLASADLYVSAMPYETFGLSVIEAQACGLPVVGVAGGAMVDRVPEGSGVGRLGPVDSVDALADNVRAMLRDPDLRAAGRRARAMVEARFSWRATFDRVLELYESLRQPRRAA